MRLNYETVLVGEQCVLVPYRREHVAKYHAWMQDAQLLEATASEPLTLEEEYEMQESWRDDSKKCTFIVLARSAVDENRLKVCCRKTEVKDDPTSSESSASEGFIQASLSAMAGDVNIFLSEEEMDEVNASPGQTAIPCQAEIDIMIAEERYRRLGLGREATCLMMHFGAVHLGFRRIFCKIKEDNEASLQLFKSLGFVQCAYAKCFREVELELKRPSNEALVSALDALIPSKTIHKFTVRC